MFSMVGGFFSTLGLFFSHLGDILISLFTFLLFMPCYLIYAGVMMVAQFAETCFKKLAGIDTIYLNGEAYGGASDGTGQDLVYAFITDNAVQDVFWSIVALSVVLLFIFTLIALIRSEFTIDLKGSAKGPIFSRAFKSLANFFLIPTITIISIFATNFLTKTIYDLFSPEGTNIVTKCFQIGAYNANRVRINSAYKDDIDTIIGSNNLFSGLSGNDLAYAVDNAFMDYVDCEIKAENYSMMEILEMLDDGTFKTKDPVDLIFFGIPGVSKTIKTLSLYDFSQVSLFYDLSKFDFILAVGSGIVIAWTLLSVCLVLVKRVFELTILFLLAPPMIAIAPLDGGQAEKKWRGEFMKRLLATIAPIFAYNVYFLMVPLFSNISLFGGTINIAAETAATSGTMLGSLLVAIAAFLVIFDIFFQLICIIVGLGILKSASALLSNLLGVDDLVKSGGEAAKKAVDVGKKAALGATAIGGVAFKGVAAAAKGAKALGSRVANSKMANKAKEKLAGSKLGIGAKNLADKVKGSKFVTGAKETIDKGKEKLTEFGDKAKGFATKTRNFFADFGLTSYDTKGEIEDIDNQLNDQYEKDEDGNIKKDKDGKPIVARKGLNTQLAEAEEEAKKHPRSKKKKEALEALKTRVGDLREQRADAVVRGSSVFKTAYDSEFGADADKTGFLAKTMTAWHAKAEDKFGNTPILNKIPDLLKSVSEQFAIDGSTAKRRLNDALAGLFGDGGGADLWKIWFNKNARAALYEGIPESKSRSGKIDASISWGSKEKWEKEEKEKKQKEADMQLMRRYMAEQMGHGEEYSQLMKALSEAEKDKDSAKVKELKVEMAQFELDTGIGKAAQAKYDAGGMEDKDVQAMKSKLDRAAKVDQMTSESQAKKEGEEIAREVAEKVGGSSKTQNVKVDSESVEKLKEAFAKAVKNGDVQLARQISETIANLNGKGGNFSSDDIVNAINELKEILESKK